MFLSVIIPVYNTRVDWIQECLASIHLLQGLCEYEVIIVNDGSTKQDTVDYLKTLNITKFHVIHQENGGLADARNSGIKQAQGQYILPLDSDDKINAHIHRFIAYLKHHDDVDILYGDLSVFGDNIGYYARYPFHYYELLLIENKLNACSIYKKSLWEKVGGYDKTFKTCEDWEFWCRCAVHQANFQYLPYANYDYRIVNNGQSLYQQTQHLVKEHHQRILNKYSLSLIQSDELQNFINQHLRQQLIKKKRKAFAMLIYALSPKFYTLLCKLGLFKRYKEDFFRF